MLRSIKSMNTFTSIACVCEVILAVNCAQYHGILINGQATTQLVDPYNATHATVLGDLCIHSEYLGRARSSHRPSGSKWTIWVQEYFAIRSQMNSEFTWHLGLQTGAAARRGAASIIGHTACFGSGDEGQWSTCSLIYPSAMTTFIPDASVFVYNTVTQTAHKVARTFNLTHGCFF